jgi:CubicO group peptidase (beta-lactamase class C family)
MRRNRKTIEEVNHPSEVLIPRLEKLLSSLMARKPVKQAIMAVESVDRSVRWVGTSGEANPDGTPMQPDTPFFIASIDKLFNATIAMKLNESRLLDLDEKISTYLPHTLTRGLHRIRGVDYSDKITIRHLLGHTSGLADWLEDRPRGGRSLVERVIDDGDMALGIEDIVPLVRDQLKPHFPPQDLSKGRQRARYCDTNYILLIAVIEAATGQPLHRVHEELLYRPLDLRHTYFPEHSQPLEPTPQATVLRFEGRPIHIPLLMRSMWGIYSTAGDTLAFLRSFVRGEVFRDPATLASMQKRWNRFGLPLDRAALRSPGWPIEYGLGIMRFRLPRILTPLHPMPLVLGHTGSTGCWLFYCPEWDMFLSGSVDEVSAGAVPYRIVPKILQLFRSSVELDARGRAFRIHNPN